jgi:CBS domain-containing protein
MSKDPITIKPGATIKVASDLMMEHDIGALPVVDISGNILGIITERDIVGKVVYKKLKPTDVKVEDIMTKEVAMAVPQMEIEDAARLMLSRDIRRLPVIECEFNKPYLHQGKCVGIVTNVDALRGLLETNKECKKEKKK